jgi:hypothetical protein
MRRYIFLAGVATGYVLGARGGREHYEKIKTVAIKVRDSQAAHSAMDTAGATGEKLLHTAMDKAPGWVPGSNSGEGDEMYVNGRHSSALRP